MGQDLLYAPYDDEEKMTPAIRVSHCLRISEEYDMEDYGPFEMLEFESVEKAVAFLTCMEDNWEDNSVWG